MAEKKIPTVRIGEQLVPAHRLWNVVESINTATDLVEKFNELRPELTTAMTREVVERVRMRIRDMDLAMGGEGALKAAAAAAGIDVDGAGDNEIDSNQGARGSTEVAGADAAAGLSNEDLVDAAKQLLDAMSVEEALAMLKTDYDKDFDIQALVKMVGQEAYEGSLKREAAEFAANMIAPDQIAELWNESGYPPPGGGIWTTAAVKTLLD